MSQFKSLFNGNVQVLFVDNADEQFFDLKSFLDDFRRYSDDDGNHVYDTDRALDFAEDASKKVAKQLKELDKFRIAQKADFVVIASDIS